jgi:asparagine synthetase B (glutamine-hydrolysing)
MFDLLGSAGPPTSGAGWRPDEAGLLPSESSPGAIRRSVHGSTLTATWLDRGDPAAAHSVAGSRLLFVVGDVWHRSDSAPYAAGTLRPSADALLAGLDESFDACLAGVKGAFTLVLVDKSSGSADLLNSRTGISPFYYALAGGRLLFSTSLSALASRLPRRPDLDAAAVAELDLFNYPIGGRTWYEGVRALLPGEAVAFRDGALTSRRWWSPASLYDQTLLDREDALEEGAELFHRVTNDLASDHRRVRVSFTSGFDSRTIVAVLDKSPADVLAYAFGIRGSLNVEIPDTICAELGIAFEPLYLEDDYEAAFDRYALRAVVLSDGLATVERANYPYAFERLAGFSPVVLTGLFGSELLRTFQNVGHLVSPAYVALAEDRDAAVDALLRRSAGRSYFARPFVEAAAPEVAGDVAAFRGSFPGLSPQQRFYAFLLQEGLRNYFGAEVHMERPWGQNRYPFLDDEFVEFAFRAPFTGVHGRHLSPGVGERFRSQYFYAHVIRKYRPELLSYPTDHGYPPADVLSGAWPLKVGPKFLARRRKKRTTRYREFRTEEWTEGLYRRRLFAAPLREGWFDRRLLDDFEAGSWKAHRAEFAKAASLKLWLEAAA